MTGACDFTLPESLFDNDYPGHYNRRLTRVSLTVVYPNPGKFDNVKATLTLVANQVRIKTDTSSGYAENPVGSDPRFIYNYAAVPQKIAMGNAQDDPGLFITAIASNIADQRYLPFENAGAISSWHLEMPQAQQRGRPLDCRRRCDAPLLHGARRRRAAPAGRAGQQPRQPAHVGDQGVQRAERLRARRRRPTPIPIR